jgi:hypothetical protein
MKSSSKRPLFPGLQLSATDRQFLAAQTREGCAVSARKGSLRRAIHEFIEHYHRERNYQRLGNELIDRVSSTRSDGGICRRPRLGGLPNLYDRAA